MIPSFYFITLYIFLYTYIEIDTCLSVLMKDTHLLDHQIMSKLIRDKGQQEGRIIIHREGLFGSQNS